MFTECWWQIRSNMSPISPNYHPFYHRRKLSVSVSQPGKKFKNFRNIFLSFLGFTLQEKDILSCEKFKNVSNIRLVHSYILGLYIRRFLGVSGNITWCIFKSFINFGNFMIRSCALKSVIGPIVDSFWDLNSPKIESRRY